MRPHQPVVWRKRADNRASVWQIKGTRVVDPWPRVFDYRTHENRWAPHLWLKLFAVFVVYIVIQLALRLVTETALLGWTTALSVSGLYLVLVGSLGLIFRVPLVQHRDSNKCKAQQITADLDGLVFEDGVQRLETAWADVLSYRMVTSLDNAGLL